MGAPARARAETVVPRQAVRVTTVDLLQAVPWVAVEDVLSTLLLSVVLTLKLVQETTMKRELRACFLKLFGQILMLQNMLMASTRSCVTSRWTSTMKLSI